MSSLLLCKYSITSSSSSSSSSSSETQLVSCINDWAKSMDRGFCTDIAIFDFSKAFDNVPHCRFKYGICGTVQNWLHSFLSDRYQRVVVDGE